MDLNSFEINQNECNNWKIIDPENSGDAAKCKFSTQATAPMPLEAIQDLFGKATRIETSALIPGKKPQGTVYVTKDFFQASPSPGGLVPDSLRDDVLGFFSMIVSYAKASKIESELPNGSVKDVTSIMPRSDFSSIYKLLKDSGAMPSIQGSLWDLINTISCYKNDGNNVA
jgi:hypothetical protein